MSARRGSSCHGARGRQCGGGLADVERLVVRERLDENVQRSVLSQRAVGRCGQPHGR